MASKSKKGTKDEPKVNKQFILDHLEEREIDLSMCSLSQVPVKELAMVPRGTRLDLSRNLFSLLPDNFGDLKHLLELDLSSNHLKELPESIGQLALLQRLDLYSNKLTMLPLTFWQLKKLRWLDMRNNKLEQGLAEAAGPCVTEAECKHCASKVLIYIKQKSSEKERQWQLELQAKREKEKKLAEEERLKQEEAKKQKAELRQRKREEHAKLEAERAELTKQQDEEEEAEFLKNEQAVGEQDEASNTNKSTLCAFLFKLFALTVMLLLLALLGIFVYCDHLSGPAQICSLWRQQAKEKWFGQFMKSIGYT